jgi:parvulin-like peptidyl-prolyl isomerase
VPPPTWIEVDKKPLFEAEPPKHAKSPNALKRIGARHILIMYQGAAHAAATIGRSREEAFRMAQEALRRARSGEDFAALVGEFSDEPGAAERGGDLGQFTRERMVQRFSEAAFALQPDEISDVVETQYGFHVIQRTE